MIGERYGSLVVIEKVKIPGKPKTYWRCRCDCGNICTVEDSHLKNGHTKSCGCRRRIRLQEKRLDLTGQRYGRLVVLGPAAGLTEKRDGTVEQSRSSEGDHTDRPDRMSDYWLCQCDCGKQCICRKENLRSGVTRSCGCLQEAQRKVNMKKAIHFMDGPVWSGSRAERHFPIILPVTAEYTEEKTTDGEHPLAFRESPTILAASQPMRRQFRRGWTRKNGYMIHF